MYPCLSSILGKFTLKPTVYSKRCANYICAYNSGEKFFLKPAYTSSYIWNINGLVAGGAAAAALSQKPRFLKFPSFVNCIEITQFSGKTAKAAFGWALFLRVWGSVLSISIWWALDLNHSDLLWGHRIVGMWQKSHHGVSAWDWGKHFNPSGEKVCWVSGDAAWQCWGVLASEGASEKPHSLVLEESLVASSLVAEPTEWGNVGYSATCSVPFCLCSFVPCPFHDICREQQAGATQRAGAAVHTH